MWLLESAPPVIAVVIVFVDYDYGLSRKCFCTAGCLSVEGWRSGLVVPRDATGECAVGQKERTQLVSRARC